jgi:hypothetical protein
MAGVLERWTTHSYTHMYICIYEFIQIYKTKQKHMCHKIVNMYV